MIAMTTTIEIGTGTGTAVISSRTAVYGIEQRKQKGKGGGWLHTIGPAMDSSIIY